MTHEGDPPDLADLARSLIKDRTAGEAAQLLAALRAEMAKQVGPPAYADGIVVEHNAGGPVTVTDTSGKRHNLRDKGRVTLRPLTAASAGSERAPFALLWVSVTSTQGSAVRIDLSALRRNASRWGDPACYLRAPGDETLEPLGGSLVSVDLRARQSAAVAAVGMSLRFDLAALFPTLLSPPPAPDPASAHG
jgi:hypothetical protein